MLDRLVRRGTKKKRSQSRQAIVIYPKSADGVGTPPTESAAKEKQNGVTAATGMRDCRSLHLIPTSPQDPGLDFSTSNETPWPAGQDHGGKTLFRLGGPTEFNYSICRRLVDSCFPFPLGPTTLASCTRS